MLRVTVSNTFAQKKIVKGSFDYCNKGLIGHRMWNYCWFYYPHFIYEKNFSQLDSSSKYDDYVGNISLKKGRKRQNIWWLDKILCKFGIPSLVLVFMEVLKFEVFSQIELFYVKKVFIWTQLKRCQTSSQNPRNPISTSGVSPAA